MCLIYPTHFSLQVPKTIRIVWKHKGGDLLTPSFCTFIDKDWADEEKDKTRSRPRRVFERQSLPGAGIDPRPLIFFLWSECAWAAFPWCPGRPPSLIVLSSFVVLKRFFVAKFVFCATSTLCLTDLCAYFVLLLFLLFP